MFSSRSSTCRYFSSALPAVALLVVAAGPPAASAQASTSDGAEPVTMNMLLEATIFQFDVLDLTVRVHGEPAGRLRDLARRPEITPAVVDSIARVGAHATEVRATLRFERDISLDRFLDEVRSSTEAAVDDGFISRETYDVVDRSLPEWYSFLESRGVEEGDRMEYRIEGDTLNTVYHASGGGVLLDQTDVGRERRLAVLGGYFAAGSDFREGLIDSLLRREREAGS